MKRIIRILAAVTAAACLLACAAWKKAPESAQSTTAAPQTTTQQTTAAPEPVQSEDSFGLSNYAHIPSGQQEIYENLYWTVSERKDYMEEDLAEFGAKIVDRVYFYYMLADHPELFYVRGGSNLYENSSSGERVARFDAQYIYDRQAYDARLEQIEAIFESIEQALPQGATEVQKAKAVYDYLIAHCAYDYDYSGNSLEEAKTTASYADGALLDGKAVCSGYSRAFKLMMDWFEIPCMCVSNSEHEWNIVFLEGNYYHVDVTWADTENNVKNRYFCVTDSEIYENRKQPNIEVPECCVVLREDLM